MDLENKGAEISARNEKYLRHLQGLVQIPSVSSVNDEHTDWSRLMSCISTFRRHIR